MGAAFSYYSIVSLLVMLASISLCWWALLCLKFERIVQAPGSAQARLLHLILAVILGQQFGTFLLGYLGVASFFGQGF